MVADPISLTICGHPSREVMADLFDLVARAGLGLVMQPRAPLSARAALPAVRTVARRKVKKRIKAAVVAAPEKSASPEGSKPAPYRQAAVERRTAVIGALRRVGPVGLSFKALLDTLRPQLLAAGNEEQQVAALRNALTILKNEGCVNRVAGQWVNCE